MKRKIIILISVLALLSNLSCIRHDKYAVIVSANMEWQSLKKVFPNENYQKSPWGEYFFRKVEQQNVLFFHEGWGKVSSAGATQYVIDKFDPEILINLGTCGGFEGEVNRFDIILVDKTVIYDIIEAMGDSKEAIADYTTQIDLSWLGENYPARIRKTLLVSADRDLRVDEIGMLKKEYGAVAGDWETGAMAYVATRNKKKILILRGVADLVSNQHGEAYGNFNLYVQRTDTVMTLLLNELPAWINYIENPRITKNKKQD
jgi:adenosylhomocysteine nucleosidase